MRFDTLRQLATSLVYGRTDADKKAIQASSDTVEAALTDLDDALRETFDQEIPAVPADGSDGVVNIYFWAEKAIRVIGIELFCVTPNTVGTYTIAIKKVTGDVTMLSAATFDLTTLVTLTPTAMTLTGTAANLLIAANGLMKITVTANNVGMNGAGLRIKIRADIQ